MQPTRPINHKLFEDSSLQPLDILLLIPLGWAAWAGWRRGFIVEVVNTIGLFLALLAGFMLLDTVVLLLKPMIGDSLGARIVLFFLIAAGVFMAVRLMAQYTRKAVRSTIFGDFDALTGAVLSLIKMALVISTFIWLMGVMQIQLPKRHTHDAFVYHGLKHVGPGFMKVASVIFPFSQKVPQWIEGIFNTDKQKPVHTPDSEAEVRDL